MEAMTGELAAWEQHRDNKEGPSHLAWSADPDVRHESQHGRSQRIRGGRTWWRSGEQQIPPPAANLHGCPTGHRPNGGK